jgi:hypothetical protein
MTPGAGTRDPFVREVLSVRLGPPDLCLGPWTLSRRGAWYNMAPLSLLGARQFMDASGEAWQVLVDHAELLEMLGTFETLLDLLASGS